MQEAAQAMTEFLHQNLVDEDGELSMALVRIFKTMPCARMPFDLQEITGRLAPEARCLVLLGTSGLEPSWCDRTLSRRHRAIPLASPEALGSAPMLAGLIGQMGLDPTSVTGSGPMMPSDPDSPELGWFYIPEALGSEYIPDQAEFVEPYRVRSVLGLGWLLVDGETYILILFSRTPLTQALAEKLRFLASSVALGLLPHENRVFPGEDPVVRG